ncbi:hypothetical protein QYE76_024746 [Lolium multiflorum]|uniref:Uncharacterized protein n=1 Tax=Lolium multiflorum TaxID=4521 RepID=A0AAD8RGP6_LOLMU|nr:hypothetical protein QYE76_024746 [Lolium multiflorum]
MGDPILFRLSELKARAAACGSARLYLTELQKIVKNWETSKPWLPKKRIDEVVSEADKLKTWLEEKEALQKSTPVYSSPAFTSEEVYQKVLGLQDKVSSVNRIPKPKPKVEKKPPKEESASKEKQPDSESESSDKPSESEPAPEKTNDSEPESHDELSIRQTNDFDASLSYGKASELPPGVSSHKFAEYSISGLTDASEKGGTRAPPTKVVAARQGKLQQREGGCVTCREGLWGGGSPRRSRRLESVRLLTHEPQLHGHRRASPHRSPRRASGVKSELQESSPSRRHCRDLRRRGELPRRRAMDRRRPLESSTGWGVTPLNSSPRGCAPVLMAAAAVHVGSFELCQESGEQVLAPVSRRQREGWCR